MYAPLALSLMLMTLLDLLYCAPLPNVHVPEGSDTSVAADHEPVVRELKSSYKSAFTHTLVLRTSREKNVFRMVIRLLEVSEEDSYGYLTTICRHGTPTHPMKFYDGKDNAFAPSSCVIFDKK